MSATISAGNGSGTTAPLTVLSPYESTQLSMNVLHNLVGGGIAVSLVPPNPRSGEIALLYDTEAAAYACAQLHAAATTFTLTETDRPEVSMTYVVSADGAVTVALDPDTLTVWVVTIGFQEIVP